MEGSEITSFMLKHECGGEVYGYNGLEIITFLTFLLIVHSFTHGICVFAFLFLCGFNCLFNVFITGLWQGY